MNKVFQRDELVDLSLEQLLDMPFEEIAEMIFKVPPKGAYIFLCTICKLGTVGTDENQKPAVVMEFEVQQTVELVPVEPPAVPVPDGTKVNIAFIGGGSIPFLRTTFGPLSASLGLNTLRGLCEKLPGISFSCVLAHRVDANNSDRIYPDLKEVVAL